MSNIGENQGTNSENAGLSTHEDLDAIFAAAYSGKPVEIPSAADPAATPSNTPDTEPSNSTNAATAPQPTPGDASTTETPAPQAGESAATNGKAPPSTPPANPNDWISGITDEALKAKIIELANDRAALAHKYNSDKPRLDQARRTVQQLQQRLASIEAGNQGAPNPNAQAPNSAPKPNGASNTPVPARPPEWSKIVEDDPNLASAVEKLLETRLNQQAEQLRHVAEQQAQAAVAPYAQYHADDAQQREFAKLDSAVGNWRDVVASPQYREWLEYYAPPICKRAVVESPSADDAIMVLREFDQYARWRWAQPQQTATGNEQTSTPASTANAATNTSVADRLAQDAARRAATAVNPASRSAPPVAPPASASEKVPTEDELTKIMQSAFKKGNR